MVSRRTIDIADVRLSIVALDAEAERTAEWFFGHDVAAGRPAAEPDQHGHEHLTVELGDNTRVAPPHAPDHVDGPVALWWRPDRLLSRHESGVVCFATDAKIGIGRPADRTDRWRSDRQLLFVALSWWFARHDAVVLHAAAIAIDGTALVVAGPTGAGKSSCVAASIDQGWQVLSDDLVVVRSSNGVRVAGIPKRVTIAADQADHLGSDSAPLPDDARMRRMLLLPLATGWYPVGALVTVGHHAGSGEVETLSHAEALQCAVASWPESPRPGAVAGALAHLGQIAGRPAFRLLHDANAVTRVERAGAMLRAICDEIAPARAVQ